MAKLKRQYVTKQQKRSHPRMIEAIDEILKHFQTYGNKQWNKIYVLFPDIARGTLRKYINRVADGEVGAAELRETRCDLEKMLKDVTIASEEEAKEKGVAHIARDIPAAPSPAYVTVHPQEAQEQLDFVVEINKIYEDALKLREYSVKRTESGEEKIQNPMIFEKQIVRRNAIIETALSTLEKLYSLERIKEFYETIVEEIGKESPACQIRIQDRLRRANEARGMTMPIRL